ncbi:MAG: PaaI family thioesterase [Clostridia bacterium]|nr:PaaI family thioesterase [Clostridia bacterium]
MMTLEQAREYFKGDRFAVETAGITIESVGEEGAVCRLRVTAKHLAAHGGVMGGALFTLADFAFAVAANACGVLTVTTESSIRFLGRAKDDTLTATCVPVHTGKRTCVYETRITDGQGTLVALVTASGMRMETR